MNTVPSILLADDDEMDVLLLERAFKHAALASPLHVVRDGEEAISFLSSPRPPPYDHAPSLIILDVKMPRVDGIEVLQWIRGQAGLRCVPVMMFSSSAHPADVERAYLLGANGYLVKPPSTHERAEIAGLVRDWIRFNQPPLAAIRGVEAARKFGAARE